MAPSCKMKLARFPAYLRIQVGAECGNNQQIEYPFNPRNACRKEILYIAYREGEYTKLPHILFEPPPSPNPYWVLIWQLNVCLVEFGF